MLDPSFFGIVHEPQEIFTEEFIKAFAEEVSCHNYCDRGDITGEDWEKILANCLGVPWEKKHSFYDVQDYNNQTAWSAKTLIHSKGGIANLISGRNSPLQKFNKHINPKKDNPISVGESILKIWNDRVSHVKTMFRDFKTIVLLRSQDLTEFRIFYYDTELYDHKNYTWEWSNKNNLHGLHKDGQTAFWWQPKGSQFTIMKRIPDQVQYIYVKPQKSITKEKILKEIDFSAKDYTSHYG